MPFRKQSVCSRCYSTNCKCKRDPRPSATQRGYNSKWERASKLFLFDHPLCEECLRQGRIKAADCVDHIIPHGGDVELFWQLENWQALCSSCHGRKTRSER
jgi:5-methylcytosine-specific restriction protein A